ncbi:hypothetical protein F5146DRAFT_1003284 [Armillaria mellea]|nr:hypothetical protein F5146DRAFT_1003284 [Armillaria mellea]
MMPDCHIPTNLPATTSCDNPGWRYRMGFRVPVCSSMQGALHPVDLDTVPHYKSNDGRRELMTIANGDHAVAIYSLPSPNQATESKVTPGLPYEGSFFPSSAERFDKAPFTYRFYISFEGDLPPDHGDLMALSPHTMNGDQDVRNTMESQDEEMRNTFASRTTPRQEGGDGHRFQACVDDVIGEYSLCYPLSGKPDKEQTCRMSIPSDDNICYDVHLCVTFDNSQEYTRMRRLSPATATFNNIFLYSSLTVACTWESSVELKSGAHQGVTMHYGPNLTLAITSLRDSRTIRRLGHLRGIKANEPIDIRNREFGREDPADDTYQTRVVRNLRTNRFPNTFLSRKNTQIERTATFLRV